MQKSKLEALSYQLSLLTVFTNVYVGHVQTARHCAVGQAHSDSMETSQSGRANSSQRTPGSSSERAKQIIELLIMA